jgi:glycosyltransferase involved in cell wall biosynthesis
VITSTWRNPVRLAVLGPISWRTPPRHYGAWETVVSNLTEGLISRGYDVTLFAAGDSVTDARLESVIPRPYSEDETLDPKVWEHLHISHAMERARDFDLLHNHFDFMPLTYSRLVPTPVVTTIHGFSLDQYRLAYRSYPESSFVSISDADRDPYLRYVATVYNGIRLEDFTFNPRPQDYLVFVGRIHPDKGVHLAIQLSQETDRPLIIAGIIQDQDYFDESVSPHLGAKIEFVGAVGPPERDKLMRNAAASLHLTTIPERFGLAMAESMATGTPVIGLDLGSVREVVADGVTGFVAPNLEQAIAATEHIPEISRLACRQRVEKLFSVDAMVDGYLEVYGKILGGRTANAPVAQ